MEHLLFEFVVRSALIAAGTAAVLGILQVKMAAARHRAWAGVTVLMMLLPVWTVWGPKASLRLLPAVTAAGAGRWTPPAETFSAVALPGLEVNAAPPAEPPVRSWRTVLAGIYLLGVCLLLARLVVGTVRADMLVRRATERGGRLTSDACAAPLTVGWLTPTVILPDCWQGWPQAQLDAVLTHEGEHARRRDPLVQWLALLNRALFWFHPLAWWLECRLSALAEEACDAAVLARGHDPFEYSEYLLEMARSVWRTGARVKVLGMAMPGSFLPQRIRRILEGHPAERISRVRMVCLGLACAMVSAVFATGAVDRRMPAQRVETRVVVPVVTVPAVPVKEPAAPVARTVLLAQVQAAPVLPAPAGQLAPVAAEPQRDRRRLVLYFDLRAMPAVDRAGAFALAQEFIRTKMQPGELLAIMTASDSVKVIQDFTDDRDRLLQTLDQLKGDSGPESGAAVDVDRQLTGLRTAVDMLVPVKGKKVLVYFGTSVAQAGQAQLQPLIAAAIRSDVAFYTINSRLISNQSALAQQPVDEALQRLEQLRQQLSRNGLQGQPPAADKAYTIGAEDVLQVRVDQPQGISGQYSVRADGTVSIVLIGVIRVAGLTVSQLEAVIADRLEANGIASHPAVTIGLVTSHSRK